MNAVKETDKQIDDYIKMLDEANWDDNTAS